MQVRDRRGQPDGKACPARNPVDRNRLGSV